jgi:hypothetical protein
MAEMNETGKVQALGRIYHGCSSIKDYELMEKLGEGTFGYVTMEDMMEFRLMRHLEKSTRARVARRLRLSPLRRFSCTTKRME